MKKINNSGQTLIALLIYMLVAMTITLAAVAVAITNIKANNSFVTGNAALTNADSGVNEAIIQLIRNPSYTGGTITLNGGTATISISGTNPIVITSVGEIGNFKRTVTADATSSNNLISITKWNETP